MTLAPEHRPELLTMREDVTRLQAEQCEAFKHSTTSAVAAVRYDVALQRYVKAKIAYEDALKAAIVEYDAQPKHAVEAHYGDPF